MAHDLLFFLAAVAAFLVAYAAICKVFRPGKLWAAMLLPLLLALAVGAAVVFRWWWPQPPSGAEELLSRVRYEADWWPLAYHIILWVAGCAVGLAVAWLATPKHLRQSGRSKCYVQPTAKNAASNGNK